MAGDLVMRVAGGELGTAARSTPSTAPSGSAFGASSATRVRRLVITASGGPFWAHPELDLDW